MAIIDYLDITRPPSSYLGSWLIVALIISNLTTHAKGGSLAMPESRGVNLTKCFTLSRELLTDANETWHQQQEHLSHQFNCTYEEIDLKEVIKNKMNTVNECLQSGSAMNEGCLEVIKAPFDENKCLKAIQDDLIIYKAELHNVNKSLSNTIGKLIEALRFPYEEKKPPTPSSSFSAMKKCCEVTLSFRLRIETITRVLNFMNSTKHPAK
ncbi:interleukin-12 subunit alpha [Microcaecilia unicolor]|uniref:Interleukin-12 subunit alpha n=1 Tax=Microcaecilia unicolor TaxID=1415580 RepID=A0A6P7Z724_9AMPH|nr:interleukin-12 subunit alpha [Microcaecilia unicolor]